MGVCEIRINTNHDLMACGTEADTMTHEIGHCIGVFEHTSDGGIMDATAAGLEIGTTPFSDYAPVIEFGDSTVAPVVCGSQDKFETDIPNTVDCIEMEAFAIAIACKRYNVPFRAYKVVSDQGGNQGHDAWLKFLEDDMPIVINEISNLL